MAAEGDSYIQGKKIPQLLESLVTALLYEQPEDPILFLEQCLGRIRSTNLTTYDWTTFNRVIVKQTDTETLTSRQDCPSTDPLPSIGSSSNAEESVRNCRDQIGDKLVIFVLGGPGSGKGTQCSRIVDEFGLQHISAGDLLREAVAKGTEQGEMIKEIMAQGKLVPPEITVTLLKQALLSNKDTMGFLIDGFPRELSQSKIFENQVCEGSFVLVFDASEGVMVERLMERGKTSGRVDDNEATIRKRLETYRDSTLPVLEHFEKLGKVRKVDADRCVDEVYCDVQALFKELTGQTSTTSGDELGKLAHKPIIFVLGGPGSGKGTQCSRIVDEFGLQHISAGDLLREEVANGTEQGEMIKETMAQGKLVPGEVTVGLLKQALLANCGANGILIDGFPRNLVQGKLFEKEVIQGTLVLVFDASEGVMVERLMERSKTSGRVDDNETTIRKRLETYKESELPVVEHYQEKGIVRKINADRAVDEVYGDVQKVIREVIPQEQTK